MQKQLDDAAALAFTPTAKLGLPLDRFVGSWEGEVTAEVIGQEPVRYLQSIQFLWALDGWFLEERGCGANGTSFIGHRSLDPMDGVYRSVYFLAPGAHVAGVEHRWNEDEQEFLGKGSMSGRWEVRIRERFDGADAYFWEFVLEDGFGHVLACTRGELRRVTPSENIALSST